ncbi:hypothetical protein MesoLjLc_35620 [Mesorhizobium sp. L-8-10]|nr:hypothetical protein MesoLjLc_35620 [Mesorhizobium sp. L-8-10]
MPCICQFPTLRRNPLKRLRVPHEHFISAGGETHKVLNASRNPKRIALSLKRSAEISEKRKSEPYRSAMSMLTFYVNRAGKNLPAERKALEQAKGELRHAFGRDTE